MMGMSLAPFPEILDASKSCLVKLLVLLLFCSFLAWCVDRVRGWQGPNTSGIGGRLANHLENIIRETEIPLSSALIKRTRVVESDFAVGAHVRGVFRPYIVMSMGMVVAISNRDRRAFLVLSHEYAHIKHWDLFLSGFMGLVVFQVFGELLGFVKNLTFLNDLDFLFKLAAFAVTKGFIWGTTIAFVSRYREFYADAKAISVFGTKNEYLNLFQKGQGTDFNTSFFHPSLDKRLSQLSDGFDIIKNVRFWKIYWPLFMVSMCLIANTYINATNVNNIEYCYYGFYVGGAMWIIVVFVRPFLLSNLPKPSI
jgi:hypothetical protein